MKILRPKHTPRGFYALPIHFTLDPVKAIDAWAFGERPAYASQADWNREMEIDFSEQVGARAYTSFSRELHVAEADIPADPRLPLCLEVDFNVDPMVWEVSQTRVGIDDVTGFRANIDVYIDEIALAPASIELMVQEFRNLYPAHRAEVWIYGDGTGHGRDAQTARSDYDLMRLAFRGYPSTIVMKVPKDNPLERDRVNAVNRRLIGADGKPGIVISPRCRELIADFEEVVWREDGKKLLKVYSQADPYHARTHASDCAGYRIAREYPTVTELSSLPTKKKAPPPRVYGRLMGDIERLPPPTRRVG